MSSNLRRFTILAIALLSALAMTASAAFAQYPPAVAFGVSCTDAGAGETAECTVVGAEANESLTASASDDDGVFDTQTITADAEGEAVFSVDIPTDVAGNVVVAVEGEVSGTASDVVEVEETVAGTPISDGGSLPLTGGEVGVLLILALTLLGGGLLTLRRREDSKVAVDA